MKRSRNLVIGLFTTIGCLAAALTVLAESSINIDGNYIFDRVMFSGESIEGISEQAEDTEFIVNDMKLELIGKEDSSIVTEMNLVESGVECPGTDVKESDHYSAVISGRPLDFYFSEDELYYSVTAYLQGIIDGEAYYVYSKQNLADSLDLFSAFKQGEAENDTEKKAETDVTEETEADTKEEISKGLAPDEEGELIFDEPYIIVDDSWCTVKLVGFYQTKLNTYGKGSEITHGFTLKITNNSDRNGGIFNIEKAYLGDEEAYILMKDGNSFPLSGKTASFRYEVGHPNFEGKKDPLESIDELYTLNGMMELTPKTEDETMLDGNLTQRIQFSFENVSINENNNEESDHEESEEIDEVKKNNETTANEDNEVDIDGLLQGEWGLEDGNVFKFINGDVSVYQNNVEQLSGTYEINTDEKVINVLFKASDNNVKSNLPYELREGVLHLFNNQGIEMIKEKDQGDVETSDSKTGEKAEAKPEAKPEEKAEEEPETSGLESISINYDDAGLIKLVQEKLNEAGFDCGTPDGISGNNTKSAIREYQTKNRLPKTGIIDTELLEALGFTSEEIPQTAKTDGANQTNPSWKASIIAELSASMMGRQEVEVTATLTGNSDDKTKVIFSTITPNGYQLEDYCDGKEYGNGDKVTCEITNDMLYTGFDLLENAFTVNVYDGSRNLIGTYYGPAVKPQWLLDLGG